VIFLVNYLNRIIIKSFNIHIKLYVISYGLASNVGTILQCDNPTQYIINVGKNLFSLCLTYEWVHYFYDHLNYQLGSLFYKKRWWNRKSSVLIVIKSDKQSEQYLLLKRISILNQKNNSFAQNMKY